MNNDKYIIREAKSSDAKNILHYFKIVTDETDNLLMTREELNNISIKEYEGILQSSFEKKDSIFLVAIQDDKVIGLGNIRSFFQRKISHRGKLGLSVRKDFWRQGIGEKILLNLIKFSENNNIKIVELEVRNDNVNAISLYKKFGFKPYGLYQNFMMINNQYYDFLLMNLNIDT